MSQWGTKGKTIPFPATSAEPAQPEAAGFVSPGGYGGYNQVIPINYDGEKDLGEMGPIRKYLIDHAALRLRSWQLYLESDVCQALFNRSTMWGIGTGLTLEAEPVVNLLRDEKINFPEGQKFNDSIEARFRTWASSDACDHSGVSDLNEIATEAWINTKVGGDVLVVMRLVDGAPKVQLIDGAHLRTPLVFGTSTGMDVVNPDNNNTIRHGVERDKKGRHVAYWVFKGNPIFGDSGVGDFERIEARMNKYPYSQTARLVYGRKYRLDNVRGIPLITAIMETAAKMSRYREAILAGNEEKAKIVMSIEHDAISTGENPIVNQVTAASGFGPQTDLPTDSMGNNLADRIAATTNKMTYNMPRGAKLNMHGKDQDTGFSDFYFSNFDIVCAVAGYPPEVILSKYNSNYSSSRAAIKDFEHTLNVERARFANQFYKIIYSFCLDAWVLGGVIDAPGYMECLLSRNEIALTAYRNAQWIGDIVPHIDPYKEIQAIRAMLGKDTENFPLATMEDAVQMLGKGGDYNAILEQYMKERNSGEEKGIELVEANPEPTESGNGEVKPQNNGNPAKQKGK